MQIANYILQYLFILLPTAVHLMHDAPEINSGIVPAHKRNAIWLCAIGIVLGFQLHFWAVPQVSWWQYCIYAGSIHFATFGYILNFLRIPKKPFFYLSNGPYDSWLSETPIPGRILLQGCILIVGFYFYHLLDMVIYGN